MSNPQLAVTAFRDRLASWLAADLSRTRADFARAAGVSQSTLIRTERGEAKPRGGTIEAYARVLGCRVGDILRNGRTRGR